MRDNLVDFQIIVHNLLHVRAGEVILENLAYKVVWEFQGITAASSPTVPEVNHLSNSKLECVAGLKFVEQTVIVPSPVRSLLTIRAYRSSGKSLQTISDVPIGILIIDLNAHLPRNGKTSLQRATIPMSRTADSDEVLVELTVKSCPHGDDGLHTMSTAQEKTMKQALSRAVCVIQNQQRDLSKSERSIDALRNALAEEVAAHHETAKLLEQLTSVHESTSSMII